MERSGESPSTPGSAHRPPSSPVDIADTIKGRVTCNGLYLVGIDGPGGAGKSALAEELRRLLEIADLVVSVVHNDDFFLPAADRSHLSAELKPVGSDFDWRRLRDQVLQPLRAGQTARYAQYDWPSDQLSEFHEIQARGIVLVEGIYCTRSEIRDLFDFRIWVECPREVRLSRGLARDGDAARNRWENDWMRAEDRYCDRDDPRAFADAIADGTSK